jgi:hypothetical protein
MRTRAKSKRQRGRLPGERPRSTNRTVIGGEDSRFRFDSETALTRPPNFLPNGLQEGLQRSAYRKRIKKAFRNSWLRKAL